MDILSKISLQAPYFLTQKRNILRFLVSVAIFAALFVAIYKPMGMMRTGESLSRWSLPLYTAITVATGFVTLLISRLLLYLRQQRRPMQLAGYAVWLVLEVGFFTLSLTVLAYLLNAREDIHFFQLMARILADIIGILLVPYIITILLFLLDEKRMEVRALSAMIHQQDENNGQTTSTINFYDRGGKLVFSTRKSSILYIESADNYTNIHYMDDGKEECFILHNSMKNVDEAYSPAGMLRCHRSYLVNIENVKLLRREKDGLVIELAYGGHSIPVSKTYADKVAHSFAGKL